MRITRHFTSLNQSPYYGEEFHKIKLDNFIEDNKSLIKLEIYTPKSWSLRSCEMLARNFLLLKGIPKQLKKIKEITAKN